MFDMFMTAFSSACSLEALVANFIGVALGIVFGALPGLTAVMGVAIHAFEWAFVRLAPFALIAATVGVFLTRKKHKV